MTRLGMNGGELGHILDAGVASVTVQGTVVTTPVRSGKYAYSFSTTKGSANYAAAVVSSVLNVTYLFRAWIRFPAWPATSFRFAELNSAGGSLQHWNLRPDGTLLRNLGGAGAVPSPVMAVDTWHCLEMSVMSDASDRRVRARLNGVQFENILIAAGGGSNLLVTNMRIGIPVSLPTGTFTVYVDDIAWNDDTGSVHNSWPGVTGRQGLLLPVVDVNAPIDWKLGNGGVWTNAWDSVNNLPPLGSATADNTKQIRNAVAASNEDVDFRLQPYSTVKGPSDVVTAIVPYVELNRGGTGTGVEGAVGMVDKPAGSMLQTNDVGSGLSNWPGNWGHIRQGIIGYPNVASADQPVIRIGKRATGTSALNCCLAGLLVEYEPRTDQQFISVV